jgi:hypothetical protein
MIGSGPGRRATSKLNIIPLCACSAMWQWPIHSPGFGSVGSRTDPLYPSMRRSFPAVRFLTGKMRRSKVSPSCSRTVAEPVASGKSLHVGGEDVLRIGGVSAHLRHRLIPGAMRSSSRARKSSGMGMGRNALTSAPPVLPTG